MTITARSHGATDRGRVRAVNQDAILVAPPLFVVADGMGGHAAGEAASATTVETFQTYSGAAAVDAQTVLDTVAAANAEIIRRASLDPDIEGMGTTVVGLAITRAGTDDAVVIFNVGDSRAYLHRDGTLRQLTTDHSLVAELVQRGELDAFEAEDHPNRHIVTRALGMTPTVDVDIVSVAPLVGDRFLLCSDGLTREVAFEEIGIVLSTLPDPSAAVEELVARTHAAGAHDNVSVVVVEITAVSAEAVGKTLDVDTEPGAAGGTTAGPPG